MVQQSPFFEKSTKQILQGSTKSDFADQGQDENDGQCGAGQQHGGSHTGTPGVTECVKGTDQGEPLGGNTTARGGAKNLHVSASIQVEARMWDDRFGVGRLDLPGILPPF